MQNKKNKKNSNEILKREGKGEVRRKVTNTTINSEAFNMSDKLGRRKQGTDWPVGRRPKKGWTTKNVCIISKCGCSYGP